MDDSRLLEAYVSSRSHEAFALLVRRHVDMVHASARRQLMGDMHLADDVTQAVFIVLARKAGTIRGGADLPGWLVKTTHLVCKDARKREYRRRRHEHGAAQIVAAERSLTKGDALTTGTPAASSATWDELSPHLDSAMARLSNRYRSLIAMRFLQGKSFREVGEALGVTEDAARHGLNRAVEKLRSTLARQGIVFEVGGSAGLAMVLDSAPPVQAAPAALLSQITTNVTVAPVASLASSLAAGALRNALITKVVACAASAAVVLLISGIGYLLVTTAYARPAARPTNALHEAADYSLATPKPTATRRYALTLPDGASVEVLGLTDSPTGRGRWWRADGSLMAQPVFDGLVELPSNRRSWGRQGGPEVYIALQRTPAIEWTSSALDVESAYLGSGGGVVFSAMRDGRRIPGVSVVRASATRKDDTLIYSLVASDWIDVHSADSVDGRLAASSAADHQHNLTLNGSAIIGRDPFPFGPCERRLLMIDEAGTHTIQTPSRTQWATEEGLRTVETYFQSRALANSSQAQLHLQARQRLLCQFHHVSLEPGYSTDVRPFVPPSREFMIHCGRSIRGLLLGMTRDQAIAVLGAPGINDGNRLQWDESALSAEFEEATGHLTRIHAGELQGSEQYVALTGIGVGSSQKNVLAMYGDPAETRPAGEAIIFGYPSQGIDFVIENERVIALTTYPHRPS